MESLERKHHLLDAVQGAHGGVDHETGARPKERKSETGARPKTKKSSNPVDVQSKTGNYKI